MINIFIRVLILYILVLIVNIIYNKKLINKLNITLKERRDKKWK